MRSMALSAIFVFAVAGLLVAGGQQSGGQQSDGAMMEESGLPWIMASGDDPILPGVDLLKISGDVVAAGSSTVFPFAEEAIARFYDEGYSTQYSTVYTSVGTGAGFERFAAGDSDISGASRPIRDAEKSAALANGIESEEFLVAFDALAVVVNPANTWATELTFEELALAFSTASTWADVRPGFPAQPITRFTPGTDSGTFDYFVEEIFDGDESPILNAARTQFSEDDSVLLQGVEGDVNAIGYFGFAYYAEAPDALTAVKVEGITPSAASVEDGSYPLARPLFMYSSADAMRERPQVAAFLNFTLTYADDIAVAVGYFPAPVERMNATKQRWVEIMSDLY